MRICPWAGSRCGARCPRQSVRNELERMNNMCRWNKRNYSKFEEERGVIMEISSISKISSSVNAWAEAQAQSKLTASSSSTATPQTASTSSSHSVASADPSSSSGQVQPTVSSVQVTTTVATHSTTVAGRTYAESVEKLGDAYVVSVPNPPGASAIGSSIESAENSLNIKLDTLV